MKKLINHITAFIAAGSIAACGNTTEETSANLLQAKAGSAISCTSIGLTPNDSVLYMHQGGQEFKPSFVNVDKPATAVPDGMVWIPGGEYSMGSINPQGMDGGGEIAMNDARPVHRVYVDGFYMDASEVTNAEFAAFVKATGYITFSERAPNPADYPGVPADQLAPGSAVFTPPGQPVPLNNYLLWWRYINGANWRHPNGPGSNIEGKENYPVVQVSWMDAIAYCRWADKRLPTEAEWEYAARGGLKENIYPWGNEPVNTGHQKGNFWDGHFPDKNTETDRFYFTAPVASFTPNGYGLYDMAGNAWEWCADYYDYNYYKSLNTSGVVDPKGPSKSYDPDEPFAKKRVIRGGSFLCNESYCTG